MSVPTDPHRLVVRFWADERRYAYFASITALEYKDTPFNLPG